MRKKILLLLLCVALLLSLAACAEKHDLLYSEEHDGITYCVRGKKDQAMQLVVKQDEKVLWHQEIDIDKSVGNLNDNYGFAVVDLNFDGYLDLMIAQKAEGELISYLCWLRSPDAYSYQLSEELSELINVKADEKLKAVFGFSNSTTYEQEYGDTEPSSITTESATKYIWKDGILTPELRVSYSYYSKLNRYCRSIAYYDETINDFEIPYDKWLTPEEYQQEDLSTFYYFK